jgi:uncharacterized protein (TIGR00369 family)
MRPDFGKVARKIEHHSERLPSQQALGARFVALEPRAVTLALPWNERLVADPGTGAIAGGAVTTMLDHACGLALVASLGSEARSGGTVDLRVDYLRESSRGRSLTVRGHCYALTEHVAFVRGEAYHSDEPADVIAQAVGTYAVLRTPTDSEYRVSADVTRRDNAARPISEPLSQLAQRARSGGNPALLAGAIPYFAFLGIEASGVDGELTVQLPGWEQHVSNTELDHLHGGVLAGLLESTATLRLLMDPGTRTAKPVTFTTTFLRGAPRAMVKARCWVVRKGRRIANVRCEAWQDDSRRPVAVGNGDYLLEPD